LYGLAGQLAEQENVLASDSINDTILTTMCKKSLEQSSTQVETGEYHKGLY